MRENNAPMSPHILVGEKGVHVPGPNRERLVAQVPLLEKFTSTPTALRQPRNVVKKSSSFASRLPRKIFAA